MELRREFELQLDVIIVIIISLYSHVFSGRNLTVQLEIFFSPVIKQIPKQFKQSCTSLGKSHQLSSSCPVDFACPVSTIIRNKACKKQKRKERKDVHNLRQGTPSHPSGKSKHVIPLGSAAVSVKLCCLNLPSP